MECRAYLYWEDEAGESYQTDVSAYLPGLEQLGQEFTLYGYEEVTPYIRSNRFVVASIESRYILGPHEERHVRLIEKISYLESITYFGNVEAKRKGVSL